MSVRRGGRQSDDDFFFNDTAATEIYTLSLHDALPIWPGLEAERLHPLRRQAEERGRGLPDAVCRPGTVAGRRDLAPGVVHGQDRKSTRLNSSHAHISYAVFCLKKKRIRRSCCKTPRRC